MKLVQIWNAKEAWEVLGRLKKQPALAYRLVKYRRKLTEELRDCEEERVKCVYAAAGKEPGTVVDQLQPGSPEYSAFIESFAAYLDNESDIEKVDMKFDDLVAALGAESNNALTELDLERLEPFFG